MMPMPICCGTARFPAGIQQATQLLLATYGGLFLSAALASPTSNQYEECHALAAASLRSCLDAAGTALPQQCWSDSRRHVQRCYGEVRRADADNMTRAEAMRKADAQRKAAQRRAAGADGDERR